jgi:hypothetical protein
LLAQKRSWGTRVISATSTAASAAVIAEGWDGDDAQVHGRQGLLNAADGGVFPSRFKGTDRWLGHPQALGELALGQFRGSSCSKSW